MPLDAFQEQGVRLCCYVWPSLEKDGFPVRVGNYYESSPPPVVNAKVGSGAGRNPGSRLPCARHPVSKEERYEDLWAYIGNAGRG